MRHEIPSRWRERVRRHIRESAGDDRDHLLAFDFPSGQSVRLDFPDGSFALFRYAFPLADAELRELAVFTEHCGYHFFPLGELKIEVLQTVWPDDDSSRERVDGEP